MEVITYKELILFGVSTLGILITILSVWSNMITKLKNTETELLLKLKDHEVQITRIDRDFLALQAKQEKDIRLTREDFDKRMTNVIEYNRKEHSKMFGKLERISASISGLSAFMKSHIENNNIK